MTKKIFCFALSAMLMALSCPVEAGEQIPRIINLKTAKQIGLTIPPVVLYGADKVTR
jgi:hypothetical protein